MLGTQDVPKCSKHGIDSVYLAHGDNSGAGTAKGMVSQAGASLTWTMVAAPTMHLTIAIFRNLQ